MFLVRLIVTMDHGHLPFSGYPVPSNIYAAHAVWPIAAGNRSLQALFKEAKGATAFAVAPF